MKSYFIGDNMIVDDERTNKNDISVYTVLCRFRNNETNDCFPSLAKISKATGMGNKTIVQAIDRLVEFGYIGKEKRKDSKGGYTSNLYKFNTPCFPTTQGLVPSGHKACSPTTQPLVSSRHTNNTYINNTKLTNNISPQNESDSPSSKIQNTYSDEFEQFWKLYLKKEGKKTAYKAFNKARKEYSLEIIVEGLESYNAQIKRNGTKKQFIKNGSTFLNGEHFNDEYEEANTNTNQNLFDSVFNMREVDD